MDRDKLKKEYDGYFGFDMIMQEFNNNPTLTGKDVMGVISNIRDYLECQLEVVKESLII